MHVVNYTYITFHCHLPLLCDCYPNGLQSRLSIVTSSLPASFNRAFKAPTIAYAVMRRGLDFPVSISITAFSDILAASASCFCVRPSEARRCFKLIFSIVDPSLHTFQEEINL